MTATQAHHPRAFDRLRHWFKPKFGKDMAGKNMSRKDLFTDAATAGAGMRSYMVMPGQPVWMDRNYYQFALEAYIKNVIAHRAMGMVSGAASSIKLKLYEHDARGRQEHAVRSDLSIPRPAFRAIPADYVSVFYPAEQDRAT